MKLMMYDVRPINELSLLHSLPILLDESEWELLHRKHILQRPKMLCNILYILVPSVEHYGFRISRLKSTSVEYDYSKKEKKQRVICNGLENNISFLPWNVINFFWFILVAIILRTSRRNCIIYGREQVYLTYYVKKSQQQTMNKSHLCSLLCC